ncbi:MAG: hypothetical protein KA210_00465 [Bacteroidia bacterium]|nr:hypothetical protein [Bacteroidia bacterium]
MKNLIKKFLPDFHLDYRHKKRIDSFEIQNLKERRRKVLDSWNNEGKPVPPPHEIKQLVIDEYQKKHGITILVETGTYMGDMVEAHKRTFAMVYSIELDDKLFSNAIKRFRYDRNVIIKHGDSGSKIFEIVKDIKKQSLFWLDGHYSGGVTAQGSKDCPILEEIDGIFTGKFNNHILLIDDARCFVGEKSYPTKEELYAYVLKYNKNYKMSVDCDIIRFEVE